MVGQFIAEAILFVGGLVLSAPLTELLFPKDQSTTRDSTKFSIVRFGYGEINATVGGVMKDTLAPDVMLFDANGNALIDPKKPAPNPEAQTIQPNEFQDVFFETRALPEYIRITARRDAPGPLCLAWVSVTAATGDKRHWNGGFGAQCKKPWYPSTSIMPETDVRPPCVWLAAGTGTPARYSLSFHLPDFAPVNSDKALARGRQWEKFPNTLCNAPARMQFWHDIEINSFGSCIPFYQNVLQFKEDGSDNDMSYIVKGNRQDDKSCIPLGSDNHAALYNMKGEISGQQPRPVFEAKPEEPWPDYATGDEPTIVRRDGKRFLRARSVEDEKCMHEIVEVADDARGDVDIEHLCNSDSSWGPDMIKRDRKTGKHMYCDMCEHELHHVCTTATQMNCWDRNKKKLRVAAHRKRDDGSSYPPDKIFKRLHRWE